MEKKPFRHLKVCVCVYLFFDFRLFGIISTNEKCVCFFFFFFFFFIIFEMKYCTIGISGSYDV